MTRKPCSRCDSADKVADLERQLAKARAKALDEAAQVSDAMMDSWAAATYRNPDARVQNAARAYAAGEIAATIRNLKGPTP